jgi:argininosuccinate lyase
MDGLRLGRECLAVVGAAIPTLEPVRARIEAALSADIYATDEAYRLVRDTGMAFRDAYREVGNHLERVQVRDHEQTLRERTHLGSTGKLGLTALGERLAAARVSWMARQQAFQASAAALLGTAGSAPG